MLRLLNYYFTQKYIDKKIVIRLINPNSFKNFFILLAKTVPIQV